MMTKITSKSPDSVIVVGMHRSGTSLTSSLLSTLGVNMGSNFIAADRTNTQGFFEDQDIVEFHQKAFRKTLISSPDGHPDWGWTTDRCVESREMASWSGQASRHVSSRSALKGVWGFKDPRTTMVLDFWDQLLPNPVYVCVYRKPSLVADSMQRLEADIFLRHPEYSWSIWREYNKRLLAFLRCNRDRCLLINIESLVQHLEEFPGLLSRRIGLPTTGKNLNDQFNPRLMGDEQRCAYGEKISRAVWSECFQLYDELEREADLPADQERVVGPWQPKVDEPVSIPADQTPARTFTIKDLSIVIPTYNDAVFLVEAITSVERCTKGDAELLICDDGSTDPASIVILDRLQAMGYSLQRQPNRGLSATRNRLIQEARGKLILPLDADNRLCPGFIENAIAMYNHDPQLGVVYGNRRLFGLADGDVEVADYDLHKIAWRNYIDACAMFRREVWEDVHGYDETFWAWEDWEFWINVGKRGWRFHHLPQIAFEYRVRPGSLLARFNTKSNYRLLNRLVMSKHFDLYSSVLPQVVQGMLRKQVSKADDGNPKSVSNWMLWMTSVFFAMDLAIRKFTKK